MKLAFLTAPRALSPTAFVACRALDCCVAECLIVGGPLHLPSAPCFQSWDELVTADSTPKLRSRAKDALKAGIPGPSAAPGATRSGSGGA